MRPPSAPAPSACCTAHGRTCCRTRTARRSSRTRSRPASTTRGSAPSTPTSRRPDGPSTCRPPTPRRWPRSTCSARPRASSRPSSPRTRWPVPRLAKELGPDATILVNLSGRGDKDVHTAAEYFGLLDGPVVLERASRNELASTSSSPARAPRTAPRWSDISRPGFPDKKTSIAAIEAMVEGGVDLVEVGLPVQRPGDGRPGHPGRCRSRPGRGHPHRPTCSTSCARSRHRRADRRDDVLEPGRALWRRPVRRRPGRGRGSRASSRPTSRPTRPASGSPRRTPTDSTASSWWRRRPPTRASR